MSSMGGLDRALGMMGHSVEDAGPVVPQQAVRQMSASEKKKKEAKEAAEKKAKKAAKMAMAALGGGAPAPKKEKAAKAEAPAADAGASSSGTADGGGGAAAAASGKDAKGGKEAAKEYLARRKEERAKEKAKEQAAAMLKAEMNSHKHKQAGAEHVQTEHKVEMRYVARSTEEIAGAAETVAARKAADAAARAKAERDEIVRREIAARNVDITVAEWELLVLAASSSE